MGNIYTEGLSFFGKTNRLISHELKNILAIITETLGLMDELMKLSDKGTALEPERLRSLSESIIEEVVRANKIIRNMNTFAHSVDEIFGDVDVRQTLALVIELCHLESSLRKTNIRLMDSESCLIYTSPIFLENLIYYILNYSLHAVGADNDISISIDSNDNAVKVTFSGVTSDIAGQFPTEREALLSKGLCAQVSLDILVGELYLVLPKKLDADSL